MFSELYFACTTSAVHPGKHILGPVATGQRCSSEAQTVHSGPLGVQNVHP